MKFKLQNEITVGNHEVPNVYFEEYEDYVDPFCELRIVIPYMIDMRNGWQELLSWILGLVLKLLIFIIAQDAC